MERALQVLCVCTHNRTRSVMMGALLQRHLDAAGIVAAVSTAGTVGSGEPPTSETVRMLAHRGLDVADHRSRKVDETMAAGARVIVTAERQHVVQLAGRDHRLFHKTFTLPELVERSTSSGAGDLDALLQVANAERPVALDYLDAHIGEIDDPTGREPAEWKRAMATIDELTRRFAELLTW